MIRVSSSRGLSFVALMAALGNVLSFISIQLAPIVPSIPLGPVSVSLALDFSHLATFIAALLGGPVVGGLTGLVGGSVAAFEFGFSKGNILSGIGIPLGKALTGVAAGLVFKSLRDGKLKLVAATLVSYVPEAVFTWVLFVYLFPPILGFPQEIAIAVAIQILVKAFIEMLFMGTILAYLTGSKGFQAYGRSLTT